MAFRYEWINSLEGDCKCEVRFDDGKKIAQIGRSVIAEDCYTTKEVKK